MTWIMRCQFNSAEHQQLFIMAAVAGLPPNIAAITRHAGLAKMTLHDLLAGRWRATTGTVARVAEALNQRPATIRALFDAAWLRAHPTRSAA